MIDPLDGTASRSRSAPQTHDSGRRCSSRQPATGSRLGGSPFPPIAEYGFLSDCETVALVAPGGSIEWLCLPRIDSPSVFGSLLDRDAGYFRFGPAGVTVPNDRRYVPGTMVLETSWGTGSGWMIVRDVLLIGAWHHQQRPLRHPPPCSDRLRRRPRAAATRALRQRRSRGDPGLRPGCCRVRHPARHNGSTRRPGYSNGIATDAHARIRRVDRADDRPAARIRGFARDRTGTE